MLENLKKQTSFINFRLNKKLHNSIFFQLKNVKLYTYFFKMKLHNLFLLAICLFNINNSFACKCVEYDKEKMVEYGLNKYDIVFY